MLFNDFVKLAQQKFGEIRLADLARELDVSAQVINGWKFRDKVPYKYVKKLNDTFLRPLVEFIRLMNQALPKKI